MDVITYFSTHQHNLSTPSRTLAMNHILDQGILADKFLEVIYFVDEKQKIVLYHAFDMLVERHIDYLNDYLDLYLSKALNETHESTKRCVSRTIFHQLKHNKNVYNTTQKQQIVNTMFDWIILPSAVATRVNAIHILYFLVDEEDWIKEQLIALIEQNLLLQEPSFTSRGKKIMKLLHKRKS
ncbi:hypothetical protein H1R17_01890 [Flavobacterium sp. xlx-214]|uniref:hypothetical protein n=1 Tax=unclassified Flavobacterium TaxID=196869 RepID=UPI0013D682B2|nr:MULTISPECIES: hypothetical protein [unclassified Flavobacterium]MBA5792774.1 hypothetical protein [Flavobacterium sp. xlx-221]QMI83911.1 hypothetical protein H1R17_01890 [Flavobacterium sp. xlx-214]